MNDAYLLFQIISLTVVDPVFSRGGRQPLRGDANILFDQFFQKLHEEGMRNPRPSPQMRH